MAEPTTPATEHQPHIPNSRRRKPDSYRHVTCCTTRHRYRWLLDNNLSGNRATGLKQLPRRCRYEYLYPPTGRQQFVDYKLRLKRLEERYEQEKTQRKEEENKRKQKFERRRQAEEHNRRTSFTELLQHCHDLLSRQLRVETPSRSTTGRIPLSTGKYCLTRLEHWLDCPEQLLRIYRSVYQYLASDSGQAPRLFSSLPELEGLGRRFSRKPLSSEQDLEAYERFGVEEHVHDIITELCKTPSSLRRIRPR